MPRNELIHYNLRTVVAFFAFLNSRIFADSFVFEKCPSRTKNIFLTPGSRSNTLIILSTYLPNKSDFPCLPSALLLSLDEYGQPHLGHYPNLRNLPNLPNLATIVIGIWSVRATWRTCNINTYITTLYIILELYQHNGILKENVYQTPFK